jgi:uncharacterized protein (DUF1778 family)
VDGAIMARPKAKKQSPASLEIRTIGLRTTKGWAEWLERAAKHSRITIASFLDRAAAEHARATGFTEPPPERLP